jgi:hypothetical protein
MRSSFRRHLTVKDQYPSKGVHYQELDQSPGSLGSLREKPYAQKLCKDLKVILAI